MGKTVILDDELHYDIKKHILDKKLKTTIQDFINDAGKEKLERDR